MFDKCHWSVRLGPPVPRGPSMGVDYLVRLLLRAGSPPDLVDEVILIKP